MSKLTQFDVQIASATERQDLARDEAGVTPLDPAILDHVVGGGGPTYGAWARVID